MHPGRIAGFNITFTEPEGWDRDKYGACWSLHAVKQDGQIRTAWFPTMHEIHALVNGAPVYLTICGQNMPATNLEVGEPAEKIDPIPRALNVIRSILGNRAVTIIFETAPTDDQLQLLKQHLSGAAK